MAAPGTENKDQASKVESSPATEGAAAAAPPKPENPPKAPAKKRGGGMVSKLFAFAFFLVVVLGAAGYAALTFRDLDPRIGTAANYIDEGLAEAQNELDKAQGLVADLTGSPKPAPKAPSRHALLDKAPLAPTPETTPVTPPQPEAAPEPAPPAPAEAAKEPEKAPVEAPAPEVKPEPKKEAVAEPPRKLAETAQPIPAPAATPAPLPVPTTAEPPRPVPTTADAAGLSDRELIDAVEGRIDALTDQMLALREKLDAPKSEVRAEPETQIARTEAEKPVEPPPPAPAPDMSGAVAVVAFALQHDLELGRPFAEEIAALSRLGVEPAPAPALVEFADKGAVTGPQLREAFLPVAKKIKALDAHEAAHDSGDLTEHLLQGASKLVKVRPTGQVHPESVEGKIERIEAALAHNDFATAESVFDSLPDEAKAEAREFGETLRQRNAAAKSADELLHGAIAALGKK